MRSDDGPSEDGYGSARLDACSRCSIGDCSHRGSGCARVGHDEGRCFSLKRWAALTNFIEDGDVPISNNCVENHIRPIALGRPNWLFAGSLRAGQRAAAIMSLLYSARINGHEPYAYLKDVLERLPTQPASQVQQLLPHRWKPLN